MRINKYIALNLPTSRRKADDLISSGQVSVNRSIPEVGYIVKSKDGTELFRLTKVPSFWGALFKIDKLAEITPDEETRCMMSLLMM